MAGKKGGKGPPLLEGKTRGERIRSAIRHSGIGHDIVAERVPMSGTALRNWFGDTKPDDERLTKFCRITGVSKRWINDGVGNPLAGDDDEMRPSAKSLLAFLAIPSTKATPDEIEALTGAMRLLGEHVTMDDWRAQLAVIRRTRGLRDADPDVDLDGYPKVR